MYIQPTEEEFGIAVVSFIDTYEDFRKAAKKLVAIMDSMNTKRYQELKALTRDNQQRK